MNHNDAPTMQSYPSPTANAADSGAGPFYGQPSTQHQQGLTNQDELQLAAQLSRTLAPNMNVGPGGMNENQDPRAPGNMNHQYQPDHQAHGGHPQMNQSQMDMGGQYDNSDGSIAARKRSKVSRACDECRRKKIRCDATGDGSDEQCANCRRVGTTCQFSRQPMKRGPSKGYIKELADRINTLEGAMQSSDLPVGSYPPPQDSPMQRRPSEEFSPTPNPEHLVRKRGYSSISGSAGESNSPYPPPRSASNWAPQDQPRPTNQSTPGFAPQQLVPIPLPRDTNYSPTNMASHQQWANAPDYTQNSSLDAVAHIAQSHNDQPIEWDENIVDSYYKYIHNTYPLLSLTKARLSSRLAACPGPVRDAFFEALYAAIRTFPSATPLEPRNTKQAINLMTTALYDNPSVRSPTTNLIYLQTMMLLAIEAGNRPYDLSREDATHTPSPWLGTSVGFAYSMRLHIHKNLDKSNNDPDSDDKLARRVWWSLIVMDRWHAAITTSPVLIPETTAQIYPEDRPVLGEAFYFLARLSIIIGSIAAVSLASSDLPPLTVHRATYSHLLKGQLELWRHEFSDSFILPSDSPVVHLSYWYAFIQVRLPNPEDEQIDLAKAVYHIASQMSFHPDLRSPFLHHFKLLAARTLPLLLQHEKTKKDAEYALSMLLEPRVAASPWDPQIRDLLGKRRASDAGAGAVVQKQDDNQNMITAANQGLQRLADLATASTEDRDSNANANAPTSASASASGATTSEGAPRKDGEATTTTAPAPATGQSFNGKA
ncbi:C6 finger domain-containing protein [Rutstroemia sp. NJR-2017a BVV2]|nr:C6 finger domain-containing protein [Rutstroemia sp. NJR-2017a BVV2]